MPEKMGPIQAVMKYLGTGENGRGFTKEEFLAFKNGLSAKEWMNCVRSAAEALGVELDPPLEVPSPAPAARAS